MKPFAQITILVALLSTTFTLCTHAQAPELDYRVSWLGNSFPGGNKWVQQDIDALTVAPDGTVYTNVGWDEAGRNVGVYQNGDVIGNAKHTHGWGYEGGHAIAINSRFVFIAQSVGNEGGGLKEADSWPAKGFNWQGVSRRLRSDITQPAPFAGGKGGHGDTLKSAFLPIAQVPDGTDAPIPGMCADETRLYVADAFIKAIKVFDTETLQVLATWPVAETGALSLDRNGVLWMLSPKSQQLTRFSVDGKPTIAPLKFAAGTVPVAFCFDARNRLLVADNGPNQQILIFDSATFQQVGTFGDKGGIGSGVSGQFGLRKWNQLSAIGCDAKNNVIVAHRGQSGGGSTVLESYAPNGKLNWNLFGLNFVDMADADPQNLSDVYTKEERFALDYSKPRGQEWKYAAYTIDRFTYPNDPRLHLWSAGAWVRRIGGQKFLFVNDMNAEYLQVYRFEPNSEIAVPCALFSKRHIGDKGDWPPHQPKTGAWMWRDANGNGQFDASEYVQNGEDDLPDSQGWWVDANGNVWLATEEKGVYLWSIAPQKNGVPNWNFTLPRVWPKPDAFAQVKRLRYDFNNDVLYLGGTTNKDKNQHWKPMGPVLARYDHFLRGQKANGFNAKWTIVAPYQVGSSGHESCEPMSFDVSSGYLFVPYTGAGKEIGFSTGHIEIFRADTGARVGNMEPSSDIGEIGLQDICECLTVRQRNDGEFLVWLEDDWKAKILMYRVHLPKIAQ